MATQEEHIDPTYDKLRAHNGRLPYASGPPCEAQCELKLHPVTRALAVSCGRGRMHVCHVHHEDDGRHVGMLVWCMYGQASLWVAGNECDAPRLSKYELTNSRVIARHDFFVHFITRTPWCSFGTIRWPHPSLGHSSTLRTRFSCVHTGVLFVTQR